MKKRNLFACDSCGCSPCDCGHDNNHSCGHDSFDNANYDPWSPIDADEPSVEEVIRMARSAA